MFEEQIRAGAKLLDGKNPQWLVKQDLEELDLNDCSLCVIGQAYFYSSYHRALHELFPEGNAVHLSQDHGFSIDVRDMTLEERDEKYAQLTEEWKELILERRKQHV